MPGPPIPAAQRGPQGVTESMQRPDGPASDRLLAELGGALVGEAGQLPRRRGGLRVS